MPSTKGRLRLFSDGTVAFTGVDMGGRGIVLSRNNRDHDEGRGYLIVKWPSSRYWADSFNPSQYSSPLIVTYKIQDEQLDDETGRPIQWVVEPLIDYENKKRLTSIYAPEISSCDSMI